MHQFATKIITDLSHAAELLRAGQCVAIPTETVYGLAANALSGEACSKIFEAKNRPRDNPLIVHISSLGMLDQIVDPSQITPKARALMSKFWPGPLTVLFPKRHAILPDEVTCGLETVGVRMPSHPIARQLIELCGFPLAAPSANSSGCPSPTCSEHVAHDLMGLIPAIVEGGPCRFGVESTVIDVMQDPPLVLRPGGITIEALRAVIPDVQVYHKGTDSSLEEKPSTPGMKYRHYSPKAKVVLVKGKEAFGVKEELERLVKGSAETEEGLVGCMFVGTTSIATCPGIVLFDMGKGLDEVAANLFKGLRELDAKGVRVIYVEAVPEVEEGLAIMNRLEKAASSVVAI